MEEQMQLPKTDRDTSKVSDLAEEVYQLERLVSLTEEEISEDIKSKAEVWIKNQVIQKEKIELLSKLHSKELLLEENLLKVDEVKYKVALAKDSVENVSSEESLIAARLHWENLMSNWTSLFLEGVESFKRKKKKPSYPKTKPLSLDRLFLLGVASSPSEEEILILNYDTEEDLKLKEREEALLSPKETSLSVVSSYSLPYKSQLCDNSKVSTGKSTGFVKVEGSSVSVGNGAFATHVIKKDDLVVQFFGSKLKASTYISQVQRSKTKPYYAHYLNKNDKGEIMVLDCWSSAVKGNCCASVVSSSTNLYTESGAKILPSCKVINFKGRVYLRAVKDTQVGEELFCVYGNCFRYKMATDELLLYQTSV